MGTAGLELLGEDINPHVLTADGLTNRMSG